MTWIRKPQMNGTIHEMWTDKHVGMVLNTRNGRQRQWKWQVKNRVSFFTDPYVGGLATSFKDAKKKAEEAMGVIVCPDCSGSREIAGDTIILDNSRTVKRAATPCRRCSGTGKIVKQ